MLSRGIGKMLFAACRGVIVDESSWCSANSGIEWLQAIDTRVANINREFIVLCLRPIILRASPYACAAVTVPGTPFNAALPEASFTNWSSVRSLMLILGCDLDSADGLPATMSKIL
jgi:hypothetical protein